MIELHEFAHAWDINPSPFCLKVETYLRLTGLPFRSIPSAPFKAPKRKLPYIVDQGRRIADSGHILDYLEATYRVPLDHGLSAEQRALGHLIRRTCEESLYFTLVYARWMDKSAWETVRQAFFGDLPPVVRGIVPRIACRMAARTLNAQGYGRHARDEIYALGIADLDALAACLDTRPFAVADRPTSFDACLHAFLVNVMRPPIEMPLRTHALGHETLVAYVARMDAALTGATSDRSSARPEEELITVP